MSEDMAIRTTVLDYFEGWFEGDARRMDRALHPELAKRSIEGGEVEHLTAATMVAATKDGRGTRFPPERRDVEIEIVDVHDTIATVVARGSIYREYIHLVRTADGWRIVNTLWDREVEG